MAFTGSNDYITGRANPITPDGAEVASMRFTLAMATGDLALNTIGQIGILPAGCIPVQVLVDGTDMDTGASAMVLGVGLGNLNLQNAAGAASADLKNTLISTVAADGGAAWGVTVATNAAFQQQILSQPMTTVTPVNYDRAIVVKVNTAPTTPAAGTLGLTLLYRAA